MWGDAVESVGCALLAANRHSHRTVVGTIRPIFNDASICPGTLTGQTLTTAADGFLTGLSSMALQTKRKPELRRSNGPTQENWFSPPPETPFHPIVMKRFQLASSF